MTSFTTLEDTVRATGLWDDGRRTGSHSFLLSPKVYEISAAQRAELDELCRAIQRALLGLSRLVGIAGDNSLSGGLGAYNDLYRRLTRATPYGLSTLRPSNLPILAKVDLMVDAAGQFKIAEIDATNPRSWGYSLVGRAICAAVDDEALLLPGVIPFVAAHLRRARADSVMFLYGETQRFYAPEFAIAADALKELGINMEVAVETAVVPPVGYDWLVDLPLMNRNKALIKYLVAAARDRSVQFLIPPKHFLSSKAVLAILSTPDEATRHLLATQIESRDLELIGRYLPRTRAASPELVASPQGLVLKRTVASGMKGVAFTNDVSFAALRAQATVHPHLFVLQAEVNQRPYDWPVYAPGGVLETTPGWYVRLTAYAARTGLQDLAVTLRRDKRVHGSTDAVVTGTVLTS